MIKAQNKKEMKYKPDIRYKKTTLYKGLFPRQNLCFSVVATNSFEIEWLKISNVHK